MQITRWEFCRIEGKKEKALQKFSNLEKVA